MAFHPEAVLGYAASWVSPRCCQPAPVKLWDALAMISQRVLRYRASAAPWRHGRCSGPLRFISMKPSRIDPSLQQGLSRRSE
ncbi:hypothetical protein ACVILK_005133 [Bradyrhizobium embrapense]